MTTVTPAEISHARSVLGDDPSAISALQVIEECQGDLEDAFEVLMLTSGAMGETNRQSFGTSLEQLAQRCRSVVCQEEFREEIVEGVSRDLLTSLVGIVAGQLLAVNLPFVLAIPIVMYIIRLGLKRYCEPADSDL